MSATPSIVIVGAGVFGLAAAWELSGRGWQVAVIDPGTLPRPAAASTDISKVVRADYGADELYTAMAEAALTGWDRWNQRWGQPLYHQDGFLLLSTEALRRGGFEYESLALLVARGHRLERLSSRHTGRTISGMVAGAVSGRVLESARRLGGEARVVGRLAIEARAAGVLLLERTGCRLTCSNTERASSA